MKSFMYESLTTTPVFIIALQAQLSGARESNFITGP